MIYTIDDLMVFLKRFHHRWLEILGLETFGIDPKLIPADLPPGLATLYRELGALIGISKRTYQRSPFNAQDCLLPIDRLEKIDGFWKFSVENSGNWTCRCASDESDPPVYSDAEDTWNEPSKGFQIVRDSLNDFLITLCLQEATLSAEWSVEVPIGVTHEALFLSQTSPLWLHGSYVDPEITHDFFHIPGENVLVMSRGFEVIGFQDRSATKHFQPSVQFIKNNLL